MLIVLNDEKGPVPDVGYEEGVEAFRVTDRLSEREKMALMGETPSKIYHWSPTKA
ncbi:MAG: hypothetical protein ACREDY_02835 [Bradyrhizobium sp.]